MSDDERTLYAAMRAITDSLDGFVHMPYEAAKRLISDLGEAGLVITTQERLDTLVASYHSAMDKYYRADDALAMLRRGIDALVANRKLTPDEPQGL